MVKSGVALDEYCIGAENHEQEDGKTVVILITQLSPVEPLLVPGVIALNSEVLSVL